MSTLRNAVRRRPHKERAQPEEREKWGILEKHKDYSRRARDYNEKKKKLKALREKAAERNEDEFYFGMLSKSGPNTRGKNSTGTLNGDRGSQVLSQDAVRLYKTQDLGYVRTMRNKTAKEVETLTNQVKGIRGDGRKVVFVDDEEEQFRTVEKESKESGDFDDEEAEEFEGEDLENKRLQKLQQKELQKLENRLQAARERLRALVEAEEALDLQRAKMAKSTSVGGVNKNGVKYKIRERKR